MNLKKNKNLLRNTVIFAIVAILAIGVLYFAYCGFDGNKISRVLTVEEAQTLIDDSIKDVPRASAKGAVYIFENVDIKVLSVEEGEEYKSLNLNCEYSSYNVKKTLTPELNNIFSDVYDEYLQNKQNNKTNSSSKIRIFIKDKMMELLSSSDEKVSGQITIRAYEVNKGEFKLHLDDNTVNTVTGGLIDVMHVIKSTKSITYGGEVIDISSASTVRDGINSCVQFNDFYTNKPATGTAFRKAILEFRSDFNKNFLENGRWIYLAKGLITTLCLTGVSAVIGVVLGFLVALIRVTYQTTGRLKILDAFCRFYLTIFRGTPLMVQLLIIYFVIFLPIGTPKFFAAVLCFGLNSGAYVSEIVRGGIMAVDKGQTEAGRSLGFNYSQTMINFIIPQAFKTVLPSLANEFITLLKESSVAFYIGVADLTQGGLKIRSQTFSNFMPLIAVALIYLVLVLILSYLVSLLERRLRKGDH